MKKILAILFCSLILFPNIALASTSWLGEGDSIMYGAGCTSPANGGLPELVSLLSGTYTNVGISGCSLVTGNGDPNTPVLSHLQSDLSTYTPTTTILHVGINDLNYNTTIATELAGLATARSYVVGTGSQFIDDQILPYSGTLCTSCMPTLIKQWNASKEELAFINGDKFARTHQDFADTSLSNEDHMNPTYLYTADGLGVHLNCSGDTLLGYLWSKASVPTRSRDWGNLGYPSTQHDSWSWWIITGTGSISGGTTDNITGYNKGGALYLSQSAYAVSDVISFVANSNPVAIVLTTTQGTPSILYRISSSNYARNDGTVMWNTYSSPISSLTNGNTYFIQIEILNAISTQLQTSQATLNWNYTTLTTYSISGTISGAAQSGITVNLTGTSSASTTTASDGTYSFMGLSAGSYMMTPGKTGYTFSPTTLTPTITTSNITGKNFTASAVVASGSAGVVGSFSGTVQ
jgi:hypothetical protein